jgi:hypothetical protein
VRWVELDGPKQKDGFTTRLAAEEWRDKHVIGEGFTGAKIESYQVRKVRDAWL